MKRVAKSAHWGLVCLALALPAVASGQTARSAPAQGGAATRSATSEADLVFWKSVAESRDRAQFDAYLAAFPQGLFAGLAKAKIAALPQAPAPAPAQVQRAAAPSSPAPAALTNAVERRPAPEPALVALDPAFVEQLRGLAQSQGNRYRMSPVTLPPRPQFSAAARLDLPAQFCSAEERNLFHDARFRPVVELAGKNNADAIAHMELLKRLHDEATAKGDSNSAMALAQESKAYEQVARSVYQERSAMDAVFPRLMAVPIAPCAGARR